MTTLGSELAFASRPPVLPAPLPGPLPLVVAPNETGGPGLCSRSDSGELAYDNRKDDMGKRKSSDNDSSGYNRSKRMIRMMFVRRYITNVSVKREMLFSADGVTNNDIVRTEVSK